MSNCLWCFKETKKEWVKYCSSDCRIKMNQLNYLNRAHEELQKQNKEEK